jgi:hypothetical protein
MGLFDSMPTKVVKLSPPEFAETANFAADMIAMEDGAFLAGRHVVLEAYAGAVIGLLAITSAEMMGGWSYANIQEITRLIKAANGRLAVADVERAKGRLRSICNVWNLNWLER